jgi:hypothetical protein
MQADSKQLPFHNVFCTVAAEASFVRAASKERIMKAVLRSVLPFVGLVWVICHPAPAQAQGRVQAARAAAEFIVERFGRPAAREGIEVLARKIESVAARFGDEAIVAAQKVGPQFFKVVEEAGVNGGKVVRVMATHGEPGVTWVLSRPKGMQFLLQHGEEAAAALVRHPGGIAEPVIEQFGGPAVKALQAVGPQGGRRLAMMLSEGELTKIGRTPELLGVVARYGDRAMEFIWKHRVVLASGAALGAFLANPEPFLNGVRDITQIAADSAIKPLFEVPGKVAMEAASRINWDLFGLFFLVLGGALLAFVLVLNSRHRNQLGVSWGNAGGGKQPTGPGSLPCAAVESPPSITQQRNSSPPLRRGGESN